MASEDIEDLACAIVRSRVQELARALQLFVVTIYKGPLNQITNPNPVCSH
jgi:hypothetical protein